MLTKSDNTNIANLLDQMSTAVIVLDDQLRIRYLNAAAEQLLEASMQHALDKVLTHVVNIPNELSARLRTAVTLGQSFTDRQSVIEPLGSTAKVVDCAITPYELDNKRLGLLIEIDRMDRPLRIARDEALLSQQGHVQSMLRGLAHEIKNPLGGLRGAAQLLEKQLNEQELHEYTSIIIREADRLTVLIDRMLGPSTRPKLSSINIHELLEHVRKVLRVGAPAEVNFTFDYDPSIPEFISDRDRLVQVLLNIAGNALNSVQSKGNVVFRSRIISSFTIGSERHPLVASIEIQDDGPGIPESVRDQIFYPMVSGSHSGTGLGLSIAQSIMNQLGGLIEFQSSPGNTVFTVLLPVEIT